MNSVLTMMNSVLKMMNSVLKMMNSAFKSTKISVINNDEFCVQDDICMNSV